MVAQKDVVEKLQDDSTTNVYVVNRDINGIKLHMVGTTPQKIPMQVSNSRVDDRRLMPCYITVRRFISRIFLYMYSSIFLRRWLKSHIFLAITIFQSIVTSTIRIDKIDERINRFLSSSLYLEIGKLYTLIRLLMPFSSIEI